LSAGFLFGDFSKYAWENRKKAKFPEGTSYEVFTREFLYDSIEEDWVRLQDWFCGQKQASETKGG
jgi:hypothetical protein